MRVSSSEEKGSLTAERKIVLSTGSESTFFPRRGAHSGSVTWRAGVGRTGGRDSNTAAGAGGGGRVRMRNVGRGRNGRPDVVLR